MLCGEEEDKAARGRERSSAREKRERSGTARRKAVMVRGGVEAVWGDAFTARAARAIAPMDGTDSKPLDADQTWKLSKPLDVHHTWTEGV